MDSIFHSNMLDVGHKFTVIGGGEEAPLSTGTIGVIHYVEGVNTSSPNIAYVRISILRYGKSGKEKLKTEKVYFPIFHSNDLDFTEIIPKDELKRYIYITPLPTPSIHVHDMEKLDYLRWAIPRAQYLYKLSRCTNLQGIWPQKISNIMTSMLNAPVAWTQDMPYTYTECCSIPKQREFIQQIRFMETVFFPCIMAYKISVLDMKKHAAHRLLSCYPRATMNKAKTFLYKEVELIEKEIAELTKIKEKR